MPASWTPRIFVALFALCICGALWWATMPSSLSGQSQPLVIAEAPVADESPSIISLPKSSRDIEKPPSIRVAPRDEEPADHRVTSPAVVSPPRSVASAVPESGTTMPVHPDRNSPDCDSIAADRVVNDWRNDMRVVCDDSKSGIRIREFVQRSFEYKPQIFHYENVDFEYFNGNPLNNPCSRGTYFEEERGNEVQGWAQGEEGRSEYDKRPVRYITDRTVIRMRRFDVYNIYEAFHAYVNTYFLIRVLNLNQSEVQFAFTDDDCGDSPKDDMWWNSINGGRFPIIFTKNNGQRNYGMVDGIAYRLKSAVRASSTGTSIVCSNHGPLRGRSHDHQCKSAAFREAVAWLRSNWGAQVRWSGIRPRPHGKVVVVWSSRRPYKRDFQYNHVPRQLNNEQGFIDALQRSLGSEQYEVINADFGNMNPPEAIEVASNADVMMGVHGAGLTWASFLPRHGGLIEVFGGDRGEGNRHYHNIAKLADIHYRSLSFHSMNWDAHHIAMITNMIQKMPLNKIDSEP